ncbi:MAG: hypothetical protein NC340_00370 [Ruminococcus flavefaciens]|nr:hypothetical protein [Ruminococcus flavefaciens]MCM1228566.1 hypothetical protein [Ruminococcus flavefaciens]
MESYNYDKWGEAIPSQAGYLPQRSVTGDELGAGAFNNPSDIFFADDGLFYIADTGNNRIVAVDSDMTGTVKIYDGFTLADGSETYLKSPSGIFVSDYIYIADSENARILVTDKDGNAVSEITKPDSEIYDQQKTFLPQKVIADKAGNIYTVLNNITSGSAVFSPDGEFTGFYGADSVTSVPDIISGYISDLFVSDSKRARRSRNIPTGITSFDIDGDFIFTCTSSRTDSVKKLNPAGDNIFSAKEVTFGDYTPMYDTSQNRVMSSEIIDIDISEEGFINCLDRTEGRIFQYDEECNLLFISGGTGKQTGTFQQATAIESAYGNIYVLDSMKNNITVFAETDFGAVVHKAVTLYNDGFYEEALEPFQEVIRLDGGYRYAYKGIASALLRQGDYKKSMEYAEIADAQDIYSKAFEGYRCEFIRSDGGVILSALIAVIIAVIFFAGRRKRK